MRKTGNNTRPVAIMSTLYTARLVLTQDDARTQIQDGAILVDGQTIVAVGTSNRLRREYPDAIVSNLGNTVILPGLINAHTHVAMSFIRGMGDDKSLFDWLHEDVFPAEAKLTPEMQTIGCRISLAELIRTGCTAFYDMYMRQDVLADVTAQIGLRAVIGESLTHFFPSVNGPTLEKTLDLIRARIERTRSNPLLRHAIAPHAVYTTDPAYLVKLREFADETGSLFYMHMSETRTETQENLRTYGKRPIPYCHELGILRDDTSLAHCVDVDEGDLEILRKTGAIPVHNPSSNLKLASGILPMQAFLHVGIPVAIGTDGPASNNAQNLFREMWIAALLAKYSSGNPASFSAQLALDLATRNGAAALHNPFIGSLEPGKQADFCALSLDTPSFLPDNNTLSNLVYASSGYENRLTVVAGRELYRDGRFLTLDYETLLAEARSISHARPHDC